jgi:hypothetical protein
MLRTVLLKIAIEPVILKISEAYRDLRTLLEMTDILNFKEAVCVTSVIKSSYFSSLPLLDISGYFFTPSNLSLTPEKEGNQPKFGSIHLFLFRG